MISRLPIAPGLALALVAAAYGCGGGPQPAPVAGDSRGVVPDLTGARVMVFPVESPAGMPGDAEAEMVFALRNRAPHVEWVMPDELRRAKAGSPGFDVRVDDLPVAMFQQVEVQRIGDPLYGYIRRLAALVDADAALLPVTVRYRSAPAPPAAGEAAAAPPDPAAVPQPGRAEVMAALVSIVDGRVVWFGVVGGEAGPPSDPAVLASALDALGRRLGPPAAR